MNAPSKLVQRINPLHLVPIYNQSFTMAALKNKASTLQQVSADLAERAGGLMRLDAQWSWGGGNRWREGCRNHVFWGSKNDELIWNTRIAQHHWVLVLIQQEICLYWWFWGMECNWLGLTWTWCSLQLCLTCRLSDKSVHLKCIEKNTNWKGMPSLYYRQRPTFSHLYPKLQI